MSCCSSYRSILINTSTSCIICLFYCCSNSCASCLIIVRLSLSTSVMLGSFTIFNSHDFFSFLPRFWPEKFFSMSLYRKANFSRKIFEKVFVWIRKKFWKRKIGIPEKILEKKSMCKRSLKAPHRASGKSSMAAFRPSSVVGMGDQGPTKIPGRHRL